MGSHIYGNIMWQKMAGAGTVELCHRNTFVKRFHVLGSCRFRDACAGNSCFKKIPLIYLYGTQISKNFRGQLGTALVRQAQLQSRPLRHTWKFCFFIEAHTNLKGTLKFPEQLAIGQVLLNWKTGDNLNLRMWEIIRIANMSFYGKKR